MLTIYLTRHGETLWNRENRLQGWMDSELTEIGINNANKLGERLKEIDFRAIYTSPSERALKTAQQVNSVRDIPIFTEPDLKEIYFGEWEGKTKEEIEINFKKEYFDFWNSPNLYNHEPHKGESLTDFKNRVEKAVKGIMAKHPDGNVLMVSHAVVIRAIMSFIMNIPTEKMWEPPFIHGTSLSVFHWNGQKFDIRMLGDISHLGG